VKRAGRRLRTEHLEVRASDSLLLHARVAVIVGKHGHTIVERNLLRRRLRELVRIRVIPAIGAMDMVVRAFPSGYEATFDELVREIDKIVSDLRRESVKP
jgi:ribonuclease P protein component